MARLERETATVNQDFKTLKETYGAHSSDRGRPFQAMVGADST